MRAGKELDEQVAQNVLGWKKEGEEWRDQDTGLSVTLLPFSANLMAAWKIVDRICDDRYRFQLDGGSRLWQARFYKSVAHTLETRAFAATGGSPAEAICLAALVARNVEIT